jgi:hypothetical protein
LAPRISKIEHLISNYHMVKAASGALPGNVNYAVKSSFLLSFLESVPAVSAKLKAPMVADRNLRMWSSRQRMPPYSSSFIEMVGTARRAVRTKRSPRRCDPTFRLARTLAPPKRRCWCWCIDVAADMSPLILLRQKLEPTHVGCYGEGRC